MPVYHFTLHAYRSWRADNKRGFVKGKKIQKPNKDLAKKWDKRAKLPPVEFDEGMQKLLLVGANDICKRRKWRMHGGATDPTHGHILLSWKKFIPAPEVERILKNVLSLFLGRWNDLKGRQWFGAHGSRRRVTAKKHFDYLLKTYFPDHKRGYWWVEGKELPEIETWFLDGPRASARGYQEDKSE